MSRISITPVQPSVPIIAMTLTNPLTPLHEQAQAGFVAYGPEGRGIPVVDTFGQYEAEYAAVRKSVGLLDAPHRGVVEVTGSDRVEFLHRMLTNEVRSLKPGEGRRAFLLNNKGRIVADVLLLNAPDRIYIDLDSLDVPGFIAELEKYLFTEDVHLTNASDRYTHLALHGPAAGQLLAELCGEPLHGIRPLEHLVVQLAGQPCVVFRHDQTGSPGLHLLAPRDGATKVYQNLLRAIQPEPQPEGPSHQRNRGRPIGWLAFNTARIEAGYPIYHIDFGPDSLPHETGITDQAVSFTKGCYVGQEIVARMQNLGHPKRVLVGLRVDDGRMPVSGTPIFGLSATTGQDEVVGAVTSSTLSPMLSGTAIVLATVKWGFHEPGTRVSVPAEGQRVPATASTLTPTWVLK